VSYQGIDNKTHYQAEPILLADENSRDILVVLAKATYNFTEDGHLMLAKEPQPICLQGEYFGAPDQSSVKLGQEANPYKLATDIAVTGQAIVPGGRTATQLDVSVRIGSVHNTVRVFGNRLWHQQVIDNQVHWLPTNPEPFTVMPVVYELAYGGQDTSPENQKDHEVSYTNPVGLGMVAKNSQQLQGTKLPNIENPSQLIRHYADRPTPAGFGFIAPHWEPRRNLAGTYDDHWEKTRMPLLPTDFDRYFYNASNPLLNPQGLLQGNEVVKIINMTPSGRAQFQLPGRKPKLQLSMNYTDPQELDVTLDTVFINTHEGQLQMLWRANHDVFNKLDDIEKIELTEAFVDVPGEWDNINDQQAIEARHKEWALQSA